MTVHLSILIFFPALFAVVGALAPPRGAPWIGLFGTLVALCYAVILLFDFDYSSAAPQYTAASSNTREIDANSDTGADPVIGRYRKFFRRRSATARLERARWPGLWAAACKTA